MKKITKEVLFEAVKQTLNEYNTSHISGPPSPEGYPASDVTPTFRKSKEEKASETGLQPKEGFRRSGFGLTSDAFDNALRKVVQAELKKLLKSKEKDSKK